MLKYFFVIFVINNMGFIQFLWWGERKGVGDALEQTEKPSPIRVKVTFRWDFSTRFFFFLYLTQFVVLSALLLMFSFVSYYFEGC